MRKYRNATINLNFRLWQITTKNNREQHNKKTGFAVKVTVEQSIIALYYLYSDYYLQQWTYVDHIIALLLLVDRLVPYHFRPVETKCAQFTVGHHKKSRKNLLASLTIVWLTINLINAKFDLNLNKTSCYMINFSYIQGE